MVARAGLCMALALASTLTNSKSGYANVPDVHAALSGTLRLVTYNVAGLPEGLSRSRPSVNMPLIGKLLNNYDIALVQEDFAYGKNLRSTVQLPFMSAAYERRNRAHFGDGLSQFARLPFANFVRRAWDKCHGILEWGSDCLTPKGFTVSRHLLAEGVSVDIYNVHLDAGRSSGDRAARASQLEQLADAITRFSADHAVILGGDTNVSSSEATMLANFRKRTGLSDACLTLRCSEPGRIDRVLFRSSESLRIFPRTWRLDNRFVDSESRPLSDHLAVAVEFGWSIGTSQRTASHNVLKSRRDL